MFAVFERMKNRINLKVYHEKNGENIFVIVYDYSEGFSSDLIKEMCISIESKKKNNRI